LQSFDRQTGRFVATALYQPRAAHTNPRPQNPCRGFLPEPGFATAQRRLPQVTVPHPRPNSVGGVYGSPVGGLKPHRPPRRKRSFFLEGGEGSQRPDEGGHPPLHPPRSFLVLLFREGDALSEGAAGDPDTWPTSNCEPALSRTPLGPGDRRCRCAQPPAHFCDPDWDRHAATSSPDKRSSWSRPPSSDRRTFGFQPDGPRATGRRRPKTNCRTGFVGVNSWSWKPWPRGM